MCVNQGHSNVVACVRGDPDLSDDAGVGLVTHTANPENKATTFDTETKILLSIDQFMLIICGKLIM